MDIILLTITDILTRLFGSNVDLELSFILKARRIGFYYNIAKEVNVLSKFATTNSTRLGTIGYFRIMESDRRKWGRKLRDEARRERG